MNQDIDDEIEDPLRQLLKRTNDDFGVTLSGTAMSKDVIETLRNELVQAKAQLPPGPEGEDRSDSQIGLKRIAF